MLEGVHRDIFNRARGQVNLCKLLAVVEGVGACFLRHRVCRRRLAEISKRLGRGKFDKSRTASERVLTDVD